MKVSGIGGANVKRIQNAQKVQRVVQNQPRNQMRANVVNRNKAERAIDRMARAGNVVKNNATNRMKVFYKALRKSMFDFMG